MTILLFKLVGGIGLFLLGMVLLTDGLKAFAGEALRQALVRFTGTPIKAFASGAVVTALVQSSSATTVTVIGFVSAGLLTFSQALGVVIGTSLGTTSTGWIVAVLGLKVNVGFYALPLVGLGAFMRLLARGRWRYLGLALAGFGLIFVGIETLQQGMQDVAGQFSLAGLPTHGFSGHLLMMLIGFTMTVIMQSSSAAVATTLTALHAEAIGFEQAAAAVIGAAIGTTVTGALAAIGSTISARRTALAHVSFNLATGLIAIIALPVFLWGIGRAQSYGLQPGAVSLAAFHTAFIGVGVLLFLPFVELFARRIELLLPDRGPVLTRNLDDSVLAVPEVALEAARRAVVDTAAAVLGLLLQRLGDERASVANVTDEDIGQALERVQQFFGRIPHLPDGNADAAAAGEVKDHRLPLSREALMHAIDHLVQLQAELRPPVSVRRLLAHEHLQPMRNHCRNLVDLAQAGLRDRAPGGWLATVEEEAKALAKRHRQERPAILRQTAGGGWPPDIALHMLDAMRWLERSGYHVARVCHYLGSDVPTEPAQATRDLSA